MHRAHLIRMIWEICARTCVVERKFSAYKQTCLVVACWERTAKCCTCLTICHVAVSKENTRLGSKTVCNLTSFPDETILHLHRIVNITSVTDDAILTDNTRADINRSILGTHYCAFWQSRNTIDFAISLDDGINDGFGINYSHIVAYNTSFNVCWLQFNFNQVLDAIPKDCIWCMFHHKRCHLRV